MDVDELSRIVSILTLKGFAVRYVVLLPDEKACLEYESALFSSCATTKVRDFAKRIPVFVAHLQSPCTCETKRLFVG